MQITSDTIEIWSIRIGSNPGLDAQVLSDGERRRAEAFRFDRDRQRFVESRIAVREILSRYLDAEPRRLSFDHSPAGKPSVSQEFLGGTPLWFNLSHSLDWALLAVTGVGEVGVDIQAMKPETNVLGIASLVCTPAELVMIQAEADPRRLFWTMWARKEAALKALGSGFMSSPEAVQVLGSRSPRHAITHPEGRLIAEDLNVAEGYCASVACADQPWTTRLNRFEGRL